MKNLNIQQVFSAFDATDEEVFVQERMLDLLENPYVLMGIVVRGVENYYLLDTMYSKKYGEQWDNIKYQIKHKYFTRLVQYLYRINFNTYEFRYMIGKDFDKESVSLALNNMIDFFLLTEEYEHCGAIKKYVDLLWEELDPIV